MHKEVIKELWKTFKEPLLYALGALVLVIVLTPFATYFYFARDLGSKESIMNRNNKGVILEDRSGQAFFTLYEARTKKIVPISDIPKYTQEAVIASEDKDFYKHPGFSITSMIRAFLSDVAQEKLAYGASTITQQLVKNALLSQNKNILRKYQEIILAYEIERRYSKNEILEMYLNSVYLGEGALGFEDAANTYFDKPSSQLTLAESALLAGILPAPSAYSPISGDKAKAVERQHTVLDRMVEQGYITAAQKEAAEKEQIVFHPTKNSGLNQTAPHFALMVKDELIKMYGEDAVARSGYTVRTTIDLEKQSYAERVVRNQVTALAYNKATNGAAVAIDPKTGAILALVGSEDWDNEKFGKVNMVTTPRQPGSSFKPIVYSKAIESHAITAATILEDKPTTFPGDYKPLDYDKRFRGPVTVRRALSNSLNIPAVEVLQMIGIPSALEMGQRLGITTLKDPSNYGLSLVLGAAEVPLIQMTSAFGTFAYNGEHVQPTTILEVIDKSGKSIYTSNPTAQQVMDAGVAYIISSILSDNKARAEEFGGALTISRPAAVKTGTTEDFRDALTIGYTPSLVVGVWVGNNDNTPMDNIAGSLGAAPIWRAMMEHFLSGTTVEQFFPPADVQQLTICKDLSTNVATTSAFSEYFLTGTAPNDACDIRTLTPSIQPTSTPNPTNQPSDTPTPTQTQQQNPTATLTPIQNQQNTPPPTGGPTQSFIQQGVTPPGL